MFVIVDFLHSRKAVNTQSGKALSVAPLKYTGAGKPIGKAKKI
jgi:hypothetical protein